VITKTFFVVAAHQSIRFEAGSQRPTFPSSLAWVLSSDGRGDDSRRQGARGFGNLPPIVLVKEVSENSMIWLTVSSV
jgi:hypothetical protein